MNRARALVFFLECAGVFDCSNVAQQWSIFE
jgi:hypothetical protein